MVSFKQPQRSQRKPSQLEPQQKSENAGVVSSVCDTREEVEDTFVSCFQEWTTKQILQGISLYFNPKSIIGIMGPSGSGKTTFLDILTGRRRGKFNVRN